MQTRQFGLIGYPLGHSFSKRYFSEKFIRENILDADYALFPLESIEDFPVLLDQYPAIKGLNVTIPHKKAVIPYLDRLDPAAAAIGAVNCILRADDGTLTGYNTDAIGFHKSLERQQQGRWATPQTQAIVLGNGGAARAVFYVLQQLGIAYRIISRTPEDNNPIALSWEMLPDLIGAVKAEHPHAPVLIVNTTPVGMAPNVEYCPEIPFEMLNNHFLVFDLIYNPEETVLLQRSGLQGSATLNGLEMLYLQADAAWEIWNA